jgi:hypothetical protein
MAQVRVVVRYPSQIVYRTKNDLKPRHYKRGKTVYTFDLRHTPSGWRVAAIRGIS